ncbi:MAG: hypothetical protein ACQCN6_05825 [Candidatus Bathyarchaeia archaeon]
MSVKGPPATYRGRSIGIAILVGLQLLIGVIHAFFGVLLLAYEDFAFLPTTTVYDVYTVAYGVLTVVFAVYLWRGKRVGWIGTVAVSLFVIVADSLTVLNLPSIPGIPRSAAPFEIIYSVIVVGYLLQSGVRRKFLGSDA